MKLTKDGHDIIVDEDSEQHKALVAEGFTVVEEEPVAPPPPPPPEKSLEEMTPEELREKAQKIGLPVTDKMSRPRLIELISANTQS